MEKICENSLVKKCTSASISQKKSNSKFFRYEQKEHSYEIFFSLFILCNMHIQRLKLYLVFNKTFKVKRADTNNNSDLGDVSHGLEVGEGHRVLQDVQVLLDPRVRLAAPHLNNNKS